jgi:hypothetical protein
MQSATQSFSAGHMMLRFAFNDAAGIQIDCRSSKERACSSMPSTFAEIVSDDFPILHAMDYWSFESH